MRLRIGAYEEEPYAFGCFMKLPKTACSRPGYEIEFLDTVLRIAGLDYEMVPNGELGEFDENASLSSGLFSTVQKGQVDLMSYFVRFTPELRQQMVFSFPVASYNQYYVVQLPSLQLKYSNYVLMPFQWKVWVMVIAALLAVIGIQWFVKSELDHVVLLSVKNFAASAWDTLRGILRLKAPGPERPTSLAATVISACWLLMWSIVILRSYRTTLISTLVIKREVAPLPFRNLDELIGKLAEKTLFFTTTGAFLPACVDELCQRLNETLESNSVQIVTDDGMIDNEDTRRRLIAEPNYVTAMMLENVLQTDAFLYTDTPHPYPIGMIDADYPSQPGGIAFRLNFPRPTLDRINHAIVKAMPGYANMIRRYRHDYPAFSSTQSLRGTEEGITMGQFIYAISILGTGTAAAIVAFLVELLYPPFALPRKRPRRFHRARILRKDPNSSTC